MGEGEGEGEEVLHQVALHDNLSPAVLEKAIGREEKRGAWWVLFSVEIARTYIKHVVMLKYINRSARISLQLIFGVNLLSVIFEYLCICNYQLNCIIRQD